MRNERIGNDISIAWEIKSGDNNPFPLEGKNVALYLHHPYGKQKVEDFRLEGNKVIWAFKGVDQKYVGKYGLTLVVNEGGSNMITTDSCDFVNLVSCSCQVGGEDNDGVQTEAIELTSTLGFIAYDDTEIREELSRLETDKADKAELTELSEEVSGLSEKIENLPTAESSVFEAIYGVTTYDELVAAIKAKKHVICFYNNRVYNLCNYQENKDIFFSCVTSAVYTLQCLASTGKWGMPSQYSYEMQNYKVTSLSSASTDTQYPSAKAVYTAIQQSGGGGASTDKQGVVSQLQQWSVKNGVYSYTMQNAVRGSIPQANIDLFTRIGAVFNEESGYFEMNSLTDISYEEMMDIYTYGNVPTLPNIEQYRFIKEVRTAILVRVNTYYNQNMIAAFQYATLESLYFSNESSPVNAEGLCSNTKYFHTLVIPDYSKGKKFRSNLSQLRVCQIAKIKANIELPISKLLTNESILYMIQNEIATSAIVITLHADVYARAMADSEITAALEAHPNVSLASE